jgi:hypothetical protein
VEVSKRNEGRNACALGRGRPKYSEKALRLC